MSLFRIHKMLQVLIAMSHFLTKVAFSRHLSPLWTCIVDMKRCNLDMWPTIDYLIKHGRSLLLFINKIIFAVVIVLLLLINKIWKVFVFTVSISKGKKLLDVGCFINVVTSYYFFRVQRTLWIKHIHLARQHFIS